MGATLTIDILPSSYDSDTKMKMKMKMKKGDLNAISMAMGARDLAFTIIQNILL